MNAGKVLDDAIDKSSLVGSVNNFEEDYVDLALWGCQPYREPRPTQSLAHLHSQMAAIQDTVHLSL